MLSEAKHLAPQAETGALHRTPYPRSGGALGVCSSAQKARLTPCRGRTRWNDICTK